MVLRREYGNRSAQENQTDHPCTAGTKACAEDITHTVYCGFAGLPRRETMFNKQIDACIDILRTGHSDDRDATALAVQQGYLQRKEDGSLLSRLPHSPTNR